MLWLVQRLFFGPESQLTASKPAGDLHFRELAVLWPLAALMLIMGVAPSFWLPSIETGVHLTQLRESAVSREKVLALPSLSFSSSGEGQR
jgi:NADH-quinone oxidoreductase subunit M